MKKLIPVFAITAILLSQAIVSTYGKENENKKEVKAEIKQEIKEGKTESKIEIKIENGENKNNIKFLEKKNDEFKIWGPIQAFSSSSVTIDGKIITIDPNSLGKFKQTGKLQVGMYAKVEGKTINETMYAEKIVVNNRNKNDIEDIDDDEEETTPTPTALLTITPSGTITVTPSITDTVTPTVSATPEVSGTTVPSVTVNPGESGIQEAFILGEIIKAFENLVASLKAITRI